MPRAASAPLAPLQDPPHPSVTAIKTLNVGEVCLSEELTITLVLVGSGTAITERVPLDVVLVLDISLSMSAGADPPLPDLKTAAAAFVDELDPTQDRVGLVSYSDVGYTDSQLTYDHDAVKGLINDLTTVGWTNIGDGVFDGQDVVDNEPRPEAVKVLVVFTDGVANRAHNGTTCTLWPTSATFCTNDAINQAATAKTAGSIVYTIGLFDGLASQCLDCVPLARLTMQSMASSPSADHFFEAPTSDDLQAIFEAIAYDITQIAARDLVINDVLPGYVQYVPGSAVPAPDGAPTQTLSWDGPAQLSIGERYTITLRVKVDGIGEDRLVDVYPDSALAYTDYQNQPAQAPFPATTVDVVAALLRFEKTGPALIAPGQIVTYELNYENYGNGVADSLILTDILPADMAYVSSSPPGVEGPSGTVRLNLGSVPPGGPYTAVLTAAVSPDVQAGQQFVNTLDWGYGACWGSATGQVTETHEIAEPELTIVKTLNTLDPVRVGEPISFTVELLNSGDGWITSLPLTDLYDPTYLAFGFGGEFADPDPDSHNDGQIDWADLLTPTQALAPGQSVTVLITFTALADTHNVGLPGDETVNSATVSGALVDLDGPGGPGGDQSMPTVVATDTVEIINPTGIALAGFWAEAQPGGALLTWQTAGESGLLGFNLLRSLAEAVARDGRPAFVRVNTALIPAQAPGADLGGTYAYQDDGLAAGTYTYLLEIVRLDGRVERYGEAAVAIR